MGWRRSFIGPGLGLRNRGAELATDRHRPAGDASLALAVGVWIFALLLLTIWPLLLNRRVPMLYRYDGSLERVLDRVTLSNGIGWTRDDTRMYYIDSPLQGVDLFDFELASGRVDNRRPFVSIDESDGIPDGLTVDDEGGVWVALYGGSCVHRYDESGQLDAVLEVPAENVTSCCFGGDDGRSLFVTTAAPDGNVYVTQPGVSGPPAHVFHAGGTRTAPSDADETSTR